MWPDGNGLGDGFGMLALLALLIWGMVYQAIRGLGSQNSEGRTWTQLPADRAFTSLRKCYARGEIEEAAFETRKRTLQTTDAHDADPRIGKGVSRE